MSEFELWVTLNQKAFVVSSGFLGALAMVALLVFVKSNDAWRVVDLVWIFVGGVGAFSALLLSTFLSDLTLNQRSVDFLKSQIDDLHVEAAFMNAHYCSSNSPVSALPHYFDDYQYVCDAVNAIEGQTARNSGAFEIISLLEAEQAKSVWDYKLSKSQKIGHGAGSTSEQEHREFVVLTGIPNVQIDVFIEDLDARYFLFDSSNSVYRNAGYNLAKSGAYTHFSLKFVSLMHDYETVKLNFNALEKTMREMRQRSGLLIFRAYALAAFAFCLPLRCGKSIHELRKGQQRFR